MQNYTNSEYRGYSHIYVSKNISCYKKNIKMSFFKWMMFFPRVIVMKSQMSIIIILILHKTFLVILFRKDCRNQFPTVRDPALLFTNHLLFNALFSSQKHQGNLQGVYWGSWGRLNKELKQELWAESKWSSQSSHVGKYESL